MLNILLGFNWIGMLLALTTLYFVYKDRAFSKNIRINFQIAIIVCSVLILISNSYEFKSFSVNSILENSVLIIELLARSSVVVLVYIISKALIKTKADRIFSYAAIHLLIVAVFVMSVFSQASQANNIYCVVLAVFYYYFVVQTYKKDNLTQLLLRHNLNFDMADLADKDYYIVLIDVDNFKLINDKYGHDRGDEVLVTIADTVKDKLPKGCIMYRFGGDEFVVISRSVDEAGLKCIFEDINSDLIKNELRISYGIVRHNAGDDGNVCLTVADKKMYENKKLLKSEDIWDDMTGLFNYRGFIDELDTFRKSVAKDNSVICLIATDVDRLSNINMAYGYTEGNLAIKTLSRVIKSCLKGRDFIGHLGSDEFAVAIECNGPEDERISQFVDELTDGIGSAYEFANRDYSLKVNLGRYFIDNDDKTSSEELVNDALYAKQTEKEDRRKTDSVSDDQEFDTQEEMLVKDILDNNLFNYALQPIVSAKDGEIVAYESLMRSKTDTPISPLKILKYAEHSKRLYDIEKYTFFNVLEKVLKTNCIPENRRIFINSIPGYMLKDGDYNLLREKYGELFERMVIEITEQREIDDEALSLINLRRDKDGFNLAIDDYGSGCSNTNSLLRYMPQVVKLDRLLITGIDRNAKKQFFVNSIISFARENDMQILAEGVETESELKTVIRLGVDMIQGFFTARPEYEAIDSIAEDIKKIIIDENLKVTGNQRMIYTASTEGDLSVVHLAMEDYSKINVSAERVKLMGNAEYTADMVVRIKDNVDCRMTLSNVCLNSVDDEPCIDIGENSNLVLYLEGVNRFNAKGIHVPEGSSLTIKGPGNLDIYAKGHNCYGIGANSESEFGQMIFNGSGLINISVDGEICTGIGGGVIGTNSEITVLSGGFKLNVAAIEAIGIGSFKGDINVNIKDIIFVADFRVNKGVVVGGFDGNINVDIHNFNFAIEGSGTEVCGVGSINDSVGKVRLYSGEYKIKLNGQKLYLLGCRNGELDLDISHTKVNMIGEGDSVIGFGSLDKVSHLKTQESSLDLIINASSPLGFGIVEKDTGFRGKQAKAVINGDDYPLY